MTPLSEGKITWINPDSIYLPDEPCRVSPPWPLIINLVVLVVLACILIGSQVQ